jgi:uncharacterized membrane protein
VRKIIFASLILANCISANQGIKDMNTASNTKTVEAFRAIETFNLSSFDLICSITRSLSSAATLAPVCFINYETNPTLAGMIALSFALHLGLEVKMNTFVNGMKENKENHYLTGLVQSLYYSILYYQINSNIAYMNFIFTIPLLSGIHMWSSKEQKTRDYYIATALVHSAIYAICFTLYLTSNLKIDSSMLRTSEYLIYINSIAMHFINLVQFVGNTFCNTK